MLEEGEEEGEEEAMGLSGRNQSKWMTSSGNKVKEETIFKI